MSYKGVEELKEQYKKNLSREEKNSLFTRFLEETPNPVLCISYEGKIIYQNNPYEVLFSDCISKTRGHAPEEIVMALGGVKTKRNIELKLAERLYTFTVVPFHEINGLFLYGSDITDGRIAEEEQLKSFKRAIDEGINIVFITNHEGVIEYVNHSFEVITGYSLEEVTGENPRFLGSGETSPEDFKNMWDTIKVGKTWRGLLKNKKKNGDFYWANGFISPIKNQEGMITKFMAIQEDITDNISDKENLQYLTEYDKVTDIINRLRFVEIIDSLLSEQQNINKTGALMQLDIDGFSLINDSYGYSLGDQFLKNFAIFLVEVVRKINHFYGIEKDAVVARLGADEFGVFFLPLDEKQAIEVAETIRGNIEDHYFLNKTIRITVSIGVALYPTHGTGSSELLARTNAATIYSKTLGQNRYSLFHEETSYLNQAPSILEEKQRIIFAIEESRIVPYFQPIINLHTNEIRHYEALARLITPDGSVIEPIFFIPTAERYGLISSVDRMIVEKTIDKQLALKKAGKVIHFSINLSGKHLSDQNMLKYLQTLIKNKGVDPNYIIFEITETEAIKNMESAIFFVRELKEMGCHFSLDDFGVGFTSFVNLIEMEVDFLKIDGVFVRDLSTSKRNRVLVKAIADMSRNLGIKTVAEFVDQEENLQILKELGVDYAQGYLVGKPLPDINHDFISK